MLTFLVIFEFLVNFEFKMQCIAKLVGAPTKAEWHFLVINDLATFTLVIFPDHTLPFLPRWILLAFKLTLLPY